MSEKVSNEAMIRLALGTVQFGLNYGIANRSGQVVESEVGTILARAAAAGMDTLDTAIAYGQSEACLGRAGVTGWRVITKLPPLSQPVADVAQWVEELIGGSLRRLGIPQLEAILLHRSHDLLGPQGETYLRTLHDMKAAGMTRAIGVSVYDPGELDRLWPLWRPDLVQAPCNVLDRRLIHSGWLGRLDAAGVRVHLRSAFLQGLLLMPRPGSSGHVRAMERDLLDRWTGWCDERGVSPLAGALAFVRSLPGVERLVVGVDSAAHLEEILAVSFAESVPPDEHIQRGSGSHRSFTMDSGMKTVAIVQARMGSTRFPGKVMQTIGGVPMIELLLRRLARAHEIDQIVLATSVDPRNRPLIEHVQQSRLYGLRRQRERCARSLLSGGRSGWMRCRGAYHRRLSSDRCRARGPHRGGLQDGRGRLRIQYRPRDLSGWPGYRSIFIPNSQERVARRRAAARAGTRYALHA